jgi:hypothetical protein
VSLVRLYSKTLQRNETIIKLSSYLRFHGCNVRHNTLIIVPAASSGCAMPHDASNLFPGSCSPKALRIARPRSKCRSIKSSSLKLAMTALCSSSRITIRRSTASSTVSGGRMKSGQFLVNLTKLQHLQKVIYHCEQLMISLSTDFVDKFVYSLGLPSKTSPYLGLFLDAARFCSSCAKARLIASV